MSDFNEYLFDKFVFDFDDEKIIYWVKRSVERRINEEEEVMLYLF